MVNKAQASLKQLLQKLLKKAKSYSKPINEFEFENNYKCDECDKHFENEVDYENHIRRKCFICDSCRSCNCAEEF